MRIVLVSKRWERRAAERHCHYSVEVEMCEGEFPRLMLLDDGSAWVWTAGAVADGGRRTKEDKVDVHGCRVPRDNITRRLDR